MISNWFGLRCLVKWCPHQPYQNGYRCVLCGKYTPWKESDP